MSSNLPSAAPPSEVSGVVVTGVGLVLVAIGLIWGVVIGYYPSDVPVLLGILIAGAITSTVGQRMYQSAKQKQAEVRLAQRDAAGGGSHGGH